MKFLRRLLSLSVLFALSVCGQFEQPYEWRHSVDGDQLVVAVEIPEDAYLYAEQTSVELSPQVDAAERPVSVSHTDEFGAADIYEGGKTHRWVYSVDSDAGYTVL